MARCAELSMRCSDLCGHLSCHSLVHSMRASLPYDSFFCPRKASRASKLCTENKRTPDVYDKSCKWPGLYFRSPSLACSRKQLGWRTLKVTKGSFPSIQGFGISVDQSTFPRKPRREIRCSSEGDRRPDVGQLTREAEDIVASVLLKAGLSEEDAVAVVSKAPIFVGELVSCIQELEESGIWAGKGDEKEFDYVDRRSQIYQLASVSRGMSPFLESLGVRLPRVSRVSRSLYQQGLPELMNKVRYLEEILAETERSEAELQQNQRPLEGLMKYMVKHLTVSVWQDEDIQQTFAFLEKMEREEGGLGALKKSSFAVPRIIEYFPHIFQKNLEDSIKPTMCFFEDLGVERDDLGRIILCFPPILLQHAERDLLPRKRALKQVLVSNLIGWYPYARLGTNGGVLPVASD